MPIRHRKPFDLGLHNKVDGPSKRAIVDALASAGHIFIPNPDKYGVDLLPKIHRERLELECRLRYWLRHCQTMNQFDTITMPAGKGDRYWRCEDDQLTNYIILRSDFGAFGMADDDAIRPFLVDNNIDWKLCANNDDGVPEPFYHLPYHIFEWYTIIDGEMFYTPRDEDRAARSLEWAEQKFRIRAGRNLRSLRHERHS